MKHLFLLLLSLYFLSSCEDNGQARTPEETCEEFMDKLADKDYNAAKKYTSGATDPYLDLLTKGAEMFQMMNQEGNNFQAITTVEDDDKLTYDCTTKGDKALCNCTHKEDASVSFAFDLIQENGQWVIHQPKETTVE